MIPSAHPPQAAVVWEEARRGEHVCMCVILLVPAAESGEQSFPVGVGSGLRCRPPPPAPPPPPRFYAPADLRLLQEG